jgi:hypothetical protein
MLEKKVNEEYAKWWEHWMSRIPRPGAVQPSAFPAERMKGPDPKNPRAGDTDRSASTSTPEALGRQ